MAEFDPANVLAGHRKVLRDLGVDYRLALSDVYARRITVPDWQADKADGTAELEAFAAEADIIQFHPGIGQPWSHVTLHPHFHDGEDLSFRHIAWTDQKYAKARRISYFHGSKNAAVNARVYADHWRKRGHAIWASTVDYVDWMEATYAPPIIEKLEQRAQLRADDDPLVIAHAPTDPSNCHTEEFLSLTKRMGIPTVLAFNIDHEMALQMKATAHAGFDHLRGAFSVNTVENCFMGLVPLVGLKHQFKQHLEAEGINVPVTLFTIETLDDLAHRMSALNDQDSIETRKLQVMAKTWAEAYWTAKVMGPKLLQKYEEVLK